MASARVGRLAGKGGAGVSDGLRGAAFGCEHRPGQLRLQPSKRQRSFRLRWLE